MAATGSSGSSSTVANRQVKRNTQFLFYILHDTTLSLEEKLEQITEVFYGDNVDVNLADDRNGQNTLLHGAVSYGYVDIVRLLLEKGADVNAKNAVGETPLVIAQDKGLTELVALLEKKDVLNVKNTSDEVSLHEAVAKGDVKNVELLLEKGTDVTVKNAAGENPLHVAVGKGFGGIVNLLLTKNPAGVNVKNATGDTPLHLVSTFRGKNKFKIAAALVSLLIKFEADVNSENVDGKTPLCVAVEQNAESVVQQLLKLKDEINTEAEGKPLGEFKKGKNNEEVKLESRILMSMQVDRDYETSKGDGSGLQEEEDVVSIADDSNLIETNATMQSDHDMSKPTLQDQENPVIEAYRPKPGPYKTSGAKISNHGTLYQSRLLMCFLLRAMIHKYVFKMGTEVDEAQQFDDLVFEHGDKKSGLERKLFLQAKHLQNSDKTITISDLLSHSKKAPFSLLKYYTSYLKLKQTPGIQADEIDSAICTNIRLCLDNAGKLTETGSTRELKFTEVTEPYKKEFFEEGKCFKLVTDNETLQLFSNEYQTYVNTEEKQKELDGNGSEEGVEKLALKEDSKVFWDFKTFLSNLIFIVEQPVGEEMIRNELRTFAGTEVKDIHLLYDSFYMQMYNWFMKREGTYLTDELVKDMIQKIDNNLDTVSIGGLSRVYAEKLLTSPVAFNAIKVDGLLEMISNHNIVHLVAPNGTKLTAVQVAQALSQSDTYKTADRFIFIRLNSILLNSTQKLVTSAFNSTVNNDVLVINCLSKTKSVFECSSSLTNLSKDLFPITVGNPKKKIVLIAPEDHPLPAMFVGCTRHSVTSVFKDLTLESQTKLLATSVTLQGQSVELSQVIDKDDKDLLDLVPLEAFISDEGLVIGTELPTSSGYNESFYIDRSVTYMPTIEVKADLFEDIYQNKFKDCVGKTESEFRQLCSEHSEANIHWIKEENGRCIWVESKGELNALQRYVDRSNSQSCGEDVFLESVTENRFVIISDSAGMGKSTY